jgi:hypothetical protein
MKILFLCGSAEPGKDGVGDYTRRLCGELIRKGHYAQILSLCDKYSEVFVKQKHIIEMIDVVVYRIPIKLTFSRRLFLTQKIVNELIPDCISLQFVPYSFNPKGLPFWLPSFLKNINGEHKWHIMFHELWVGIETGVPLKYKCLGFLQKKIIQFIVNKINPNIIHTQSKIYEYYLSSIGIKAENLPLFGNIPVSAIKNHSSNQLVFVVFATIHDNAPFEGFIIDLKNDKEINLKNLKFVFIGRHGDKIVSWTKVLDFHNINYDLLGPQDDVKISQVLMNSDYGISTSPFKISDKSGVVAAMREHEISIICVAKNWNDRKNFAVLFNDIIQYKKGNLSLVKSSTIINNSLSNVSSVFLKSISK